MILGPVEFQMILGLVVVIGNKLGLVVVIGNILSIRSRQIHMINHPLALNWCSFLYLNQSSTYDELSPSCLILMISSNASWRELCSWLTASGTAIGCTQLCESASFGSLSTFSITQQAIRTPEDPILALDGLDGFLPKSSEFAWICENEKENEIK